jgi:pseudouridine-5'-phosphate glycosidase/sugar/nucleoside kinase (ribokinase family)
MLWACCARHLNDTFVLAGRSMRTTLRGSRRRNSSSSSSSTSLLLRIDPAVQRALRAGRPVVALESTIVAHGMPYPENWHLSQRVAAILRGKGVEPATIGTCKYMKVHGSNRTSRANPRRTYCFAFTNSRGFILLCVHRINIAVKDGVCRVGLTVEEMEDLARSGAEGRAQKCSTRELCLVVAQHRRAPAAADATGQASQWGATTVASTMRLAHIAGISTFVTGGIGGVHRDGHMSMDVSADLLELSRTPVVVVSAGIKSILDIRRTLEVLETNSVPIIAYQTDEIPAFFSPHSGVAAPARMDDVDTIAEAYWAANELGLSHGMMVAVPNHDPAGSTIEDAIQSALQNAAEQNVTGQAVTPFVLKAVAAKTSGESLKSNMELVEHNAEVGADIAIAIAQQKSRKIHPHHAHTAIHAPIVVMGGVLLDIVAKPTKGEKLRLGTSNPALCTESDGGVARNIAEVLSRLGSLPLLYSAVGKDDRGLALLDRLSTDFGITSVHETIGVVEGANTATYLAILNEHGDLHTACADTDVLDCIQVPPLHVLEQADILVLDANPPTEILHQTAMIAMRAGTKIFLEPTSAAKAVKVGSDRSLMSYLTYASPNLDELSAMADGWSSTTDDHDVLYYDEDLSIVRPLAEKVIEKMNPAEAHLIVTCGVKGVLLASRILGSREITFQRFPAPKGVTVQNATGAGDSLSGAFVYALLRGKSVPEAVKIGMDAAMISLQCSHRTISPNLSSFTFS